MDELDDTRSSSTWEARVAELERENHLLALLYQLYGEMTEAPTVDRAVEKLLAFAVAESAARDGLAGLLDEEAAKLRVHARTGRQRRARADAAPSDDTIDLLVSPLRTELGKGATIRGAASSGSFLFASSKSQLVLPVPHGGLPVALLVLESPEEGAFAGVDLYVLEKVAEQAGAVLFTRNFLERSRKEIALLWDVGTASDLKHLDQSELDELLAKILEIALGRLRVQNGFILLVDEESGDLIVESRALRGAFIRRPPFRLKRRRDRPSGISFWVVENNRPYVAGDITKDPNYVPLFHGIQSNVAVPIPFQERAIGAIVLESVKKEAFGPEDVATLEELAKQAAKFVRRAQLYRKTREVDHRGIMIRGLSPEWNEAEELLERVSGTGATVLLRGESGTGKELIANAIHFNSRRSRRQFVVVNCAAIPAELLESELFGHAKGAFTGAAYEKIGEFEKANGGTLFLDEIGDLSLPLQVKLLRALQSGEIAKIGSNEPARRVDVRVIAATSRDLDVMMREGRFREDLYYRLNVVSIWLPPLRKYRESIPGMVDAFIREANRVHERNVEGVSPDALAKLMSYHYPGNVRELKNVVERGVILEKGRLLTPRSLPPEVRGGPAPGASASAGATSESLDYKEARRTCLEKFEESFVNELLARSEGNVQRASEMAQLNRVNLHKLLARRGIDPRTFKGAARKARGGGKAS